MDKIFTNIYENSTWGKNNYKNYNGSSGAGSRLDINKDTYIPFLKNFIIDNNIKTIVDLGSGDFICGPAIYDDLDIEYTGYDAYKKIQKYNSKKYNSKKYNFIHLDFCNNKEDIINSDLCILKDVLQHWSLDNIYKFLDYLISSKKYKYILIINCSDQTKDNTDINTGDFRFLSCDFFPLKKYNPIKLYNYNRQKTLIENLNLLYWFKLFAKKSTKQYTKEVSVIDINNTFNILNFLKVYNFDDKIRLGGNSDGGYVLGELNETYDCYISAGISNEDSFSRDFIKKYNMNEYNSFALDGTIKSYPYKYGANISFIKKNINNFNDNNNTNLSFLIKKYNNIFLKMDIEGGEYPWILSLDDKKLNKFKQIVIEIHGIKSSNYYSIYYNKVKCLSKLSNLFYLIHAHGNNYSPIINGIPDVIELTYVNKNYFTTVPRSNKKSLPSKLDFPNKTANEVDLNFYPFVKK